MKGSLLIEKIRFSCAKIIILIFVSILIIPVSVYAQNQTDYKYSSVASGDWSSASTWSRPDWTSMPPAGQTLIVNSGHTVTCNVGGGISGMGEITINGTLVVNGDFSSNNKITIGPSGILIVNGDFTPGETDIEGKVTVSGSFSTGNKLTLGSSGTLDVGGDFTPCTLDISGKITVGGGFKYTCGSADIKSTGSLIINGTGSFNISTGFNIEGKVLISGSVSLTGGNINLSQSGLLVVGKDLSNNGWNNIYAAGSSKLLVQGNLTAQGHISKSSDAQIAVLGDINSSGKTILGCDPNCDKPSSGCTSCQVLDTIDPTNPDWQIPNGITALWWEDFHDNGDGSEIEDSKWQAIGNSDGYRTTTVSNKQLQSIKIQNKSDSRTEVWKSAVIDISCYQNVNISGYTYSGSSTSVNNLYYQINGTSGWQQISRDGASGYNRVTGRSGNTLQLSWWVSGDASTCSLDNVGVYGTAVAGCSSGSPLCLMTNQQDASCEGKSDGSATVSATGGTGSYTYSWSPSGGANATATGLLAGDYSVTVVSGSQMATISVTIKALHSQASTKAIIRE